MKSRNVDELCQSIKGFSFDDPLADAIERGKGGTFNISTMGGIYEVSRYIRDNWTVKELGEFLKAWDATPYDDKETIMGALPKPNDPKDEAAWEAWLVDAKPARRVLSFDSRLRAIYEAALLAIGAKCYADCKREEVRMAFALDSETYFNQTLTELEKTLPPPFVKMLHDIGKNTEHTQDGVSFLVHDRMGKRAANSKRGKESHKKAVRDEAERLRANRDVETALNRVADDPNVKAGKHGAILDACRRVCKQFTPLTGTKKNERIYLPLTRADGKPLKPETLARYCREGHGGKRGKK